MPTAKNQLKTTLLLAIGLILVGCGYLSQSPANKPPEPGALPHNEPALIQPVEVENSRKTGSDPLLVPMLNIRNNEPDATPEITTPDEKPGFSEQDEPNFLIEEIAEPPPIEMCVDGVVYVLRFDSDSGTHVLSDPKRIGDYCVVPSLLEK